MILLLILAVWVLAVVLGVALLPFRPVRWAGVYLIVVSTMAVAFAGVIGWAGVWSGSRIAEVFNLGDWGQLLALAGFGLGVIGGAALGATLGFGVVLVCHLRARRRRELAKAAAKLSPTVA